jgi:cAMP-dependent protein kinase regulator
MALVENAPRSATVYAAAAGAGSKVKVAFLERESFERLLGPCLDIMKRKMKTYQKSS